MPDNEAMLEAERDRAAYSAKVDTPRERKYREALEKLQAGIFFIDRRDMKTVIDKALEK